MSSLHRGHDNLFCIIPTLVYVLPKWAAHILCYKHIYFIYLEHIENYACVLSRSVVFSSLWPRVLYPIRLLCPWDSPGKNTGVGCRFLFQGIFPTQGSTHSPTLACEFFTTVPPVKLHKELYKVSDAYYTKWSKSEREKHIYIWNLERWYWWTHFQGMKKRCRLKEHTYGHEEWWRKERVEQMETYTLCVRVCKVFLVMPDTL